MPNSATLVQALGAVFCAILCALSGMGGGGMMCASRIGAWAKSGGPTPQEYGGLKFTAEAANSSVQLDTVGSMSPPVTLIKSFDGVNWSKYDDEDVIELKNVGDFVYLAAGEGGNETLATSQAYRHTFVMSGSISASGDITSLIDFSLKQTPLPAYCYLGLFRDCSSLVSAPILPATDFSGASCYRQMFLNCTSLTDAPEIPVETFTKNNVLFGMFDGCSSLSSIKVKFNSWPSGTTNWVRGVSSTGTFYKPNALSEEYGTAKIPTGWTVVNID